MSETLIGYARCSTDEQDLTAQRLRLAELGVAEERVYLDPARQQRERVRMSGTGEYTIADLAEVFAVSRTTVYRTLQRAARSSKVS